MPPGEPHRPPRPAAGATPAGVACALAVALALVGGCGVGGVAPTKDRPPHGEASEASGPTHPADPPRGEWPGLLGPHQTGVADEWLDAAAWPADGPRALWRRPVGTGYSSPVVAGGRLVLQERRGDQESVLCLDAATGDERWRFDYPTHFECPYEYSNGPYSTPLVAGGRVYVLGAEAQARCLRLDTGALVWERRLAEDYRYTPWGFPFGGGMALAGDRLVLNLGAEEAGVVALDAATGETLWAATSDRPGYATPRLATFHGRPTALVFTFEGLLALDPSTGAQQWSMPFRPKAPDSYNATTPVVSGDLVLVVTGPGPGARRLRVEPDGGYRVQWSDRRVLDSQFNTLIEHRGYVYGYSSKRVNASLRCIELATGKLCWSWESDLQRGTSVLAGEHLIAWGEAGHLAVVRASPEAPGGRPGVVWESPEPLLEGPCYASPALASGRLYLRNEREVLCLAVPTHAPAATPSDPTR